MTISLDESLQGLARETGTGSDAVYLASKYHQGGRTHYSLQLPLAQVIRLLPKPNPEEPFEGNRAVNENHARGFAEYLLTKPDWVSPAVMVRISEGDIREADDLKPITLPAQKS